jgi:hypothetical protein
LHLFLHLHLFFRCRPPMIRSQKCSR